MVSVQPAHAQIRLGHVQQPAFSCGWRRDCLATSSSSTSPTAGSSILGRCRATAPPSLPMFDQYDTPRCRRLPSHRHARCPQALHGRDLVKDPEDDANDVKFLVNAVEEHRAAKANLHQRHNVHERHHAPSPDSAAARVSGSASARASCREVRDEQSDDREDVTHGEHGAVNHCQRHLCTQRRTSRRG